MGILRWFLYINGAGMIGTAASCYYMFPDIR